LVLIALEPKVLIFCFDVLLTRSVISPDHVLGQGFRLKTLLRGQINAPATGLFGHRQMIYQPGLIGTILRRKTGVTLNYL
jgi:hypothetical protein